MEGDTVKMENVEEKSRAKKHCKKKPKVGPPMKTCEEMAKETKGKLEAKKGEVISSNAKPDAGSKDGKGVAKDSRAGTGGKKLQRRKSEGPKMKRKVSNLVFVMPKEADPQAKVQAVAEKKIGKLMRYMKKYWTVHVDKKFYPVKIDFRMPDRMTHQRPENWWLAKRARQKTIDHTGFFSNVMEPYHDLGPPELDTPMLAFKNMHEDLLTDPTKWIQDRIEKDEMIRKCNAPLIRLPRTRVRRPVFNKGRVKIGAGGMLNMDKFVKTGYDFQNAIRGGVSFSLTLDNYMEQKENEIADSASAFGVVVKKQAGNEKAPGTVPSKPGMQKQSEESGELKHTITALKLSSDNKKRSNADDRALQRSLLIFEQMMQAIYDMIRSTLNIRGSQLRSNHPLPLRVVQDIRSTSPVVHVQRRAKKAKVVKDSKSCKDLARSVMSSAILGTGVATTKSNLQTHQDAQKAEKVKQEEVGMGVQEGEAFADGEDEDSVSSEMSIKALIHHRGKSVLHTADIDPNHHEEHIATTIVETVKAAHAERDTTSILEEKVKTIRESAEQATNRMLLREETFARLFHKGETLKPPVWKNINIDILFTTDKDVTVQEDTANAVGKEIEGFHLDNENAIVNLPSTPRIPHANEIPTPKLEGLESPPRVDSEEQSKLNLLEKNPEAARKEPPPSPVVYLYKVAGIQTNEKQMFNSLMTLKKKFRATEKALRFYYANETEKEDWETLDRFRRKIRAILPCPIYERSITIMRQAQNKSSLDATMSSTSEKRPALWYRKLRERSDEIGASRHIGCSSLLMKLYKYCDVDMKTRSKMLNRFCLLVVSLPTTELGTREWQLAIKSSSGVSSIHIFADGQGLGQRQSFPTELGSESSVRLVWGKTIRTRCRRANVSHEWQRCESYYETFSSDGEDFLESMAVRISDRFNGGDQRGRRMIDGARLDSDEMNLLTISTAGSKWRGEDDEDDSVMTRTTSEQMIPGARFNILGKMQMRKSSSSPVVQTPSPPPRSTRKSPTEHQQINLEQLANLSQSDVCVKNERNNKGLLESRKSPLLSHDNNNNGSSNSDESIDSPLDFSISAKKSKFRLEEPQTEAQSSRLRNILSMKSPVISENLQGTILNLSKESPNLAAATWSCPIKKSRMSSESRSGSSSCSPVPMDHHSSDFLPSSPTRAEVKGGITLKAAGGIPTTSSPLSVSTTLGVGAMGYPPYGVFSTANLSPVMNQTVPSVPLPLPYETSPPLLAHQVNGSSTSPNLPFGSALSGSLPASNGAAAKGRVTRPFKAYPKDPMSFSAIGLYGLPMGTSPGSTEALIHQQSNVAYAEFRKQMLSQTQSSRSRRGGQRNGSDSFNSSAGDAMNCNGNGSSNEDSHSANEDSGRSTSGKTEQQLKDEAYWERRRKNNEAAKRSRDARRAKEDEIAIRAAFLEQENLKLRFELCALKNETAKLRCMLYST